jgi:hypothetical protein
MQPCGVGLCKQFAAHHGSVGCSSMLFTRSERCENIFCSKRGSKARPLQSMSKCAAGRQEERDTGYWLSSSVDIAAPCTMALLCSVPP